MGTKPRGADKQTLRRSLSDDCAQYRFFLIFTFYGEGGGVLTILYGVQSSFVHLSIIIIKEV